MSLPDSRRANVLGVTSATSDQQDDDKDVEEEEADEEEEREKECPLKKPCTKICLCYPPKKITLLPVLCFSKKFSASAESVVLDNLSLT